MDGQLETLYQTAQATGLAHHVLQWGSLANVAQYRVPFDLTLRHLRPPRPVLDWGCGNGHCSFF